VTKIRKPGSPTIALSLQNKPLCFSIHALTSEDLDFTKTNDWGGRKRKWKHVKKLSVPRTFEGLFKKKRNVHPRQRTVKLGERTLREKREKIVQRTNIQTSVSHK